jgi:glycosyltransferase involved in cell wall biosynthesis
MAVTGVFHTDGGIAEVNRLVLQSLAQAGFEIEVFSLLEENSEIDTRYVHPRQVNYDVFGGDKLRFTLSVWRALLATKYDIVFSDHVNVAAALAPLSRLRCCRYVVWLHGIEVFDPKPDLEGCFGITSAWKCLAGSYYTKKRVMERFPHLTLTVCELALDSIRFQGFPVGSPVLVKPIEMQAIDGEKHLLGTKVILFVGRMSSTERHKGPQPLLKALPRVLSKHPDAQLLLVGRGADVPGLHSLAKSLPSSVQAAIFMPGYVQDAVLNQLYQSCYLFAMPSIGEGFGLVYLEAMSYAKPCLGSNCDATPYVVQNGITGLLVDDPRSHVELADKINWLLAHPLQAREMGIAGYRRVTSHYLFQHFKERLWNALEVDTSVPKS